MASKPKLRGLWFSVHKWIGLALAALVIPISLSGAALVWHDWLDERLEPRRYAVTGAATLPPARYAQAAAEAVPGLTITALRYPDGAGPVIVTALDFGAASPPLRTNVYLDGATAQVLDVAGSNEGVVRFLHVLHGSLRVPGLGRQIVGWVGVGMLVSSLTGLWLWWPLTGSVSRGLRWKRRPLFDANLHHQLGFWICVPLAMLSLTGAWISFPAFFGPMVSEKAPQRPPPVPPLAAPVQAVNDVALKGGAAPVSITWPTGKRPVWKLTLDGGREAEIADATGAVTVKPARPETIARTMRRWHDGDGMGPVWQTIIFLGGLFPAVLAVTGVTMWLASRKWRRRPTGRLAAAE